jgi:hypothetical protein
MAPFINTALLDHNENETAFINLLAKTPAVCVTSLPSTPTTPTPERHESNTLVLDPSLITQEFDLLRFEAAAFDQLPKIHVHPASTDLPHDNTSPNAPALSNLLISSPYNNPDHYLDLTTLTTPSLLFAKALTALQPLRADYATAPYTEALNFDHVLSVLRDLATADGFEWKETSFHVVVFRSKLKDGIDVDHLYKLDYESHREACESGGLLKYWFGKTDGERRNLATCKSLVLGAQPNFLFVCCSG